VNNNYDVKRHGRDYCCRQIAIIHISFETYCAVLQLKSCTRGACMYITVSKWRQMIGMYYKTLLSTILTWPCDMLYNRVADQGYDYFVTCLIFCILENQKTRWESMTRWRMTRGVKRKHRPPPTKKNMVKFRLRHWVWFRWIWKSSLYNIVFSILVLKHKHTYRHYTY